MLGRLTGRTTMQYEPTAKPDAQVLTLEGKATLQEGLALTAGEDMGDIYIGIIAPEKFLQNGEKE
jgi:hypothetical protein